jgi:hypothetical protein
MNIRRLEATVIGPGAAGFLKVSIGRGHGQFVADVRSETLPDSLRLPNSHFVAVVSGREFIRVEPAGRVWLEIQERIREVLNASWDPIGVAGAVDDEYDGYIGSIFGLLQRGAPAEKIAEHLSTIETDRMGLESSSSDHLLDIADRLRTLALPNIGPV